ncbi:hypothetical protein TNCV_445281 [Trichonephila clavipes]|nr:hypothetical protein TNCV_445281 [Trichonephila clavipes]
MEHFDFQTDSAALEQVPIDFQIDLPVKSPSSSSENIWPLVPKKNLILVQICLKVKSSSALHISECPWLYAHEDSPQRRSIYSRTVQQSIFQHSRNDSSLLNQQTPHQRS